MRNTHSHSRMLARFSLILAFTILTLATLVALQASAEETRRSGDFTTSTATPSTDAASVGDTITYTLIATNSSAIHAPNVFARQLLVDGQSFASAQLITTSQATTTSFIGNSGGITWTGSISPSGSVMMSLVISIEQSFNGTMMNTDFEIVSGFSSTTIPSSVRVGNLGLMYFPILIRSPLAPTLLPITGAEDGTYTVSWQNNDTTTGMTYVLEESASADFATPNVVFTGPATSHNVTGKSGGIYYYRVKAEATTGGSTLVSSYSNVKSASVFNLTADLTAVAVGTCTTLRWDFTGINGIRIRLGKGYALAVTSGQSNARICPAVTTTYEVEVTLSDNSVITIQETVTVTGTGCANGAVDPYINQFSSNKTSVTGNESVEITWNAQCAYGVEFLVDRGNNGSIDETTPVTGEEVRTLTLSSTTRYILRVYKANSIGNYVDVDFVVTKN